MKLDPTSEIPLYKQVKSQIRGRLSRGEIAVGGKLPSERQLIVDLGVSRITVRQALKELVHEGELVSIPGKGFYRRELAAKGYELNLLRSFTETTRAGGRTPGSRLISCSRIPAGDDLAGFLQVEPGTDLVELRRVRLIDGVPAAINIDWVVARTAPGLEDLDWSVVDRSLYSELIGRYNLAPAMGETRIGAVLCTEEQAAHLDIALPAALILVEQIAFAKSADLVNGSRSYQIPDLYPLVLQQDMARPR